MRACGAVFHFNLKSGNLWVSLYAFGVDLDDLQDPSPSKGIKRNEFQLQLSNFKSGSSKKFLL